MFAGAVGRGRIDKVVLARRVDVRSARRTSTSSPPSGTSRRPRPRARPSPSPAAATTFLGATPERLARTVGRSFETVAIAGSAPRGADPDEDARFAAALLASEKDREEHAVVVDTLRAGLAPIVETLTVADTPGILPLRHVQHLVTPMTGTLRDDAGLLALAALLHPTPAVGGEPRDVALDLIAEHEGFDRGWYAGPIGWLGADGDGELMVALRCGLVRGRDAVLFAGCGIVADSDPAREWEESRLKLRTMIAAPRRPGGGRARDRRPRAAGDRPGAGRRAASPTSSSAPDRGRRRSRWPRAPTRACASASCSTNARPGSSRWVSPAPRAGRSRSS